MQTLPSRNPTPTTNFYYDKNWYQQDSTLHVTQTTFQTVTYPKRQSFSRNSLMDCLNKKWNFMVFIVGFGKCKCLSFCLLRQSVFHLSWWFIKIMAWEHIRVIGLLLLLLWCCWVRWVWYILLFWTLFICRICRISLLAGITYRFVLATCIISRVIISSSVIIRHIRFLRSIITFLLLLLFLFLSKQMLIRWLLRQ